jgi:hypothetical protein
MIPDYAKFREFERRLVASEPADFDANLRMVDEMYRYARELGKFSGSDPLEGVEVNIRVAKVFRSVQRAP